MQETQVQSLDQEDPLEKETATHSSIIAWKVLWTEEPGGPQSIRLLKLDMTERLNNNNCSRICRSLNSTTSLELSSVGWTQQDD